MMRFVNFSLMKSKDMDSSSEYIGHFLKNLNFDLIADKALYISAWKHGLQFPKYDLFMKIV